MLLLCTLQHFLKKDYISPCRGVSSLTWVVLSCPTLTQFSRIAVLKDYSSVFGSKYCTPATCSQYEPQGVPLFPSSQVEYLFNKDMGLIPLATEYCFSLPVVFFFFLLNGLVTKTLIFYSLNLFPLSLTISRISCFFCRCVYRTSPWDHSMHMHHKSGALWQVYVRTSRDSIFKQKCGMSKAETEGWTEVSGLPSLSLGLQIHSSLLWKVLCRSVGFHTRLAA